MYLILHEMDTLTISLHYRDEISAIYYLLRDSEQSRNNNWKNKLRQTTVPILNRKAIQYFKAQANKTTWLQLWDTANILKYESWRTGMRYSQEILVLYLYFFIIRTVA